MKTEKVLLWAFVILFIGVIIFGRLPDSVGFPHGFYWQLTENQDSNGFTEDSQVTLPVYAKDAIKIINISSRRSIYSIGENATVDIFLDNPYNLNYNLSVYWILDDSRNLEWSTQNNITTLYSWKPLNREGNWIANVVVSWNYENQTYDTDKHIKLEVLR